MNLMQHMHLQTICKKRRGMHLKKNKAWLNFSNNLEQEKPLVIGIGVIDVLDVGI